MRQTKTHKGRIHSTRRTGSAPAVVLMPVRRVEQAVHPANPSAHSKALFPYPALFWFPVLLCFVGLLFQYSVGIGEILKPNNPAPPLVAFRTVIMQSIWLVVGLVVMAVLARTPTRFWSATAGFWLIVGVLAVAVVFVPGIGKTINYATRWIEVPVPVLGKITLQPSEAFKLITLFWLAWLYSTQKRSGWSIWAIGGTILWLCGVVIVERQPDLGTAILITLLGVGVAFLGGARIGRIVALGSACIVAGAFVVLLPVIKGILKDEPWQEQRHAYRLQRIIAVLDPWQHQQDIGYQMVRAQLAVGSGGIARWGIGEGREKRYLPAAENDYIFATIAEETGFVGSVLVIVLMGAVVYHCFRLATRASTRFGQLFVLGLALWIGLSTLINIGMAIGMLPTVGLPLPFVSAGGSALLSLMAGLGIAQSVARERT